MDAVELLSTEGSFDADEAGLESARRVKRVVPGRPATPTSTSRSSTAASAAALVKATELAATAMEAAVQAAVERSSLQDEMVTLRREMESTQTEADVGTTARRLEVNYLRAELEAVRSTLRQAQESVTAQTLDNATTLPIAQNPILPLMVRAERERGGRASIRTLPNIYPSRSRACPTLDPSTAALGLTYLSHPNPRSPNGRGLSPKRWPSRLPRSSSRRRSIRSVSCTRTRRGPSCAAGSRTRCLARRARCCRARLRTSRIRPRCASLP